MEYSIISGALPDQLAQHRYGCVALGVYEEAELTSAAAQLDHAADGWLGGILQQEQFKGKAGDGLWLPNTPVPGAARLLILGLGKRGKGSDKNFAKAAAAAIRSLKSANTEDVLVCLAEAEVEGRDLRWKTRILAQTFEDGLYAFTLTKRESEGTDVPKLQRVKLLVPEDADSLSAKQGALQGQAVGTAMKLVKDLGNLPGNVCTPTYLAQSAQKLEQQYPQLKVEVLEDTDMEKLGMGALLSVAKGSCQPPKLITLEYRGGAVDAKPVVLVGKGLTFDAGGISLKPAAEMDEMKYDMCGGASVLGIMQAVAQLKLPLNVVGVVAASENLPDGAANKPGDVVTSMAGKTIEILNTDAEGRLLLCDALCFVERYEPSVVVDIATLTGACIVALGRQPSGLLGNDDALCDALTTAGEKALDRVWRLPLWEEYQEQIKSNFADLANVGGRDAGTITAACFLSRFAEKFKWAHLDIAGTAWRSGKDKGATGRPVPVLMQFLFDQAGL